MHFTSAARLSNWPLSLDKAAHVYNLSCCLARDTLEYNCPLSVVRNTHEYNWLFSEARDTREYNCPFSVARDNPGEQLAV